MSDAVLSQFAQTVEAQQIDASKKLKVGIIGTGWIAEAHVESYKEMPDVDDFAAAFIRLEGGVILDFRIAWAMHINTPGDTIIMGKWGALRIPSTECWNGSVGGPMTLYQDVAGQQTETIIPIIRNSEGFGGLFYQKIRSFLDAVKAGAPAPVPTLSLIHI